MKSTIITLNGGSSSLKFALFALNDLSKLFYGVVQNIGHNPQFWVKDKENKIVVEKEMNTESPDEVVFQWIKDNLKDVTIEAIGHRVVHGGHVFKEPVLVTNEVLSSLKKLIPLAPLHQPYNITLIEEAKKFWHHLPQIASFDTSFHQTQQKLAILFPLPQKFTDQGIIRYGFHGLSYEYIASVLEDYVGKKAKKRVIIAHLGSGASMCALYNLQSIATTMGFTALDGLMMGSRTGSIDPGVILYLLEDLKMSLKEVTDLLYNQSGLKGVSDISHDMKELLKSDHPNACLAIDLFCYIAAKHMAALLPSIKGLDVLVFTGGIGENCPEIRQKITVYFQWLGLKLDERANMKREEIISNEDSLVDVLVLPTNEELLMAKNIRNLILKDSLLPSNNK